MVRRQHGGKADRADWERCHRDWLRILNKASSRRCITSKLPRMSTWVAAEVRPLATSAGAAPLGAAGAPAAAGAACVPVAPAPG